MEPVEVAPTGYLGVPCLFGFAVAMGWLAAQHPLEAAAGAFGNASQGSGLAWGRGQRAESCSNILLFALGAALSVVESLEPPFFLLNQLCSPLRTSVNQHAGDVAFDVR